VFVAAVYMRELRMGPLHWLWYVFLLVTGGQVGVPTALIGCVLAGLFGSSLAIAVARWRAGEKSAMIEA
jgi:hypothetical protein